MQKILNVLIVENQPIVIDALKKALWYINNVINVVEAKNYNLAKNAIENKPKDGTFDIVLINMGIPIVNSEKIVFIDDLVLSLRKNHAMAKVIVLTQKSNHYMINTIFKNINPESILVKTEVSFNELIKAIKAVLIEPPYYSKIILRFLKKRMAHDISLDKVDRALLYYLSRGAKTKDLHQLLNLSTSAIERRKRILKDIFNVTYDSDYGLLREARDKGFI